MLKAQAMGDFSILNCYRNFDRDDRIGRVQNQKPPDRFKENCSCFAVVAMTGSAIYLNADVRLKLRVNF